MDSEAQNLRATTHFAPAERASQRDLLAARSQLLASRIASVVLEGVPDPVLVVNEQRQIVACNSVFLHLVGAESAEELLGLRPGEAARCIHCQDGPGGCGTGQDCVYCGAVNAVVDCLRSREVVSRECRLRIHSRAGGGVLDLLVRASFVSVGDYGLAVVALRDIGADKRRRVLERVFFHDVLNTVTGIQSLAWVLDERSPGGAQEAQYKRELRRLAEQVADEIHAQRQLLLAEQGELKPQMSRVSVPRLLRDVVAAYQHHNVAVGRTLALEAAPDVAINTDPTLLRRVLGNLIKNALEATPEGGAVRVSAETQGDAVVFRVHNPGAMPEAVQRQIFQRSFSTKQGEGRGIGTHSVRLFTERYLGGQVGFTSTEADGTAFTVSLPLSPP
jgi:nitrogen-specific signal transduction histidine kinase